MTDITTLGRAATDPVVDVASRLQLAIDDLANKGGGVLGTTGSRGTYDIASPLVIRSGVTLDFGTLNAIGGLDVMVKTEGPESDICVQNMRFTGDYFTALKFWGTGDRPCVDVDILNCKFQGGNGPAIDLDAVSFVEISYNRILWVGPGGTRPSIGVLINGTGSRDIRIHSNRLVGLSRGGVITNNTVRCDVYHNIISEVTGDGVVDGIGIQFYQIEQGSELPPNEQNSACGNHIEHCAAQGVYVQGSERTRVSGNDLTDCCTKVKNDAAGTFGAIAVAPHVPEGGLGDSMGVTVEDNNIWDTRLNGITIWGVDQVVRNNTIDGADNFGLLLRGLRGGSISGNTFLNNKQNIMEQGGTRVEHVKVFGNKHDAPEIRTLNGTEISSCCDDYELGPGPWPSLGGWTGGTEEQEWSLRFNEPVTLLNDNPSNNIPMKLNAGAKYQAKAGDFIRFRRTSYRDLPAVLTLVTPSGHVDLPNSKDGKPDTFDEVEIMPDDYLTIAHSRPFRGIDVTLRKGNVHPQGDLAVRFTNGAGQFTDPQKPTIDHTKTRDSIVGFGLTSLATSGIIRWLAPYAEWDGSSGFWIVRIDFSHQVTQIQIQDVYVLTDVHQEVSRS